MSQRVTAIYENGILRLLAPLDLPERAHVEITVDETSAAHTPSSAHRRAVRAALHQTETGRAAEGGARSSSSALTDEERARYARLFAADPPLADYIREDRDAR